MKKQTKYQKAKDEYIQKRMTQGFGYIRSSMDWGKSEERTQFLVNQFNERYKHYSDITTPFESNYLDIDDVGFPR